MNSARLSPVLVCLALAPGCGSSPGQTTSASATDGSSGADTTTSAASTTSTTTDEVTTGAPDSTGAASTSTTTTTGTSTGEASTGAAATGSTDTGSTDTGSTACEPSWVVPSVAAEELAKHDLQWVSCELLTCGADDLPQPGVLCDEFSLAGVPLEYLGHIHPNDSGAFTTGDVIGPTNIAWLDAPRHTYRYGDAVYVMTEQDGAADQLEVFFTVRALEILRTDHPAAYQKLVVDVAEFPAEQPLDGLTWKNRVRSVVISFDTSPLYIAAGITVLDAAPTKDKNLDQYSNVAAISIDRETIRGASDEVGSRPIYQKPGDDENFLRYMREGIAETLVHELLHRYVDRLNSVDAAMNDLYFRRGDMAACARFELEEALVAAASLLHFRKAGGIGETYLDYYDVVLDANLEVVMQCPEFAAWEAQYSAPSGVDPRYDLRLVDL